MLRIAIQKSGRLNEDSVKLLKECGLKFAGADRKLIAKVENFDLEILYLRDDDIPRYVHEGVAHIGIVGENVYNETALAASIEKRLGFGKCRLSLAIPKEAAYTGVTWFEGKKIATSYPNTLAAWLKKNNIHAITEEISGSVEIATGIGLADAICDLVSSGSTLISNGLAEVETILKSEAVLIANPGLTEAQKLTLQKLLFRIDAVQKAEKFKYILLNAPLENKENIIKILPGMKSPTVLPLATQGWCSIHTVIDEDRFWEIIEKLKNEGAQGILVVPIEKMIV